ncbi:MAG TPA: sugar phosphate isomerase/epimerase [Blastocatellia bacterium]|nr:sugar phosphate isomerase/epimerase [Blastocatellia bacterium]HMV84517.1 sugar phosphate isomerase/epimerase [Blastocatellia bacterium]HMX28699.1 sugar phosphate isomerase/epimerase [Blastocatellia bacterium]HMY75053.1 sugar phosphate isomerase/epimerase [Blastocatellia bacterium]HMZ17307.1 sugar phosphate isomerase/epimerase [Blastocatellia bacterium]
MNTSRREFLAAAGAAAMIGSTFQSDFQIGYHAITWGEKFEQAVDEISELGFRGIQIRAADYRKYANRAGEFKELMAGKKLTVVSMSSGGVTVNSATAKQEIEERTAMAKWMKDVGGLYLQATDDARVRQGVNDPDDYRKLGKRLTEIGKRTFGEHGVKLGYHNHMDTLGQRQDEVDRIMDATDAKYVWLLPDIAHIQAAGGDPVKFVRNYITRLVYPHFKDVIVYSSGPATMAGKQAPPKYSFVELGQGKVNFPGVLQIMKDYRWTGWIIIELDSAPAGHTPKESAAISKKYVEERLKLKV